MRFTLLIDTTLCSLGARRRVSRVFLGSVGVDLAMGSVSTVLPLLLSARHRLLLRHRSHGGCDFRHGVTLGGTARNDGAADSGMHALLQGGRGGGGRVQACFAVVWYSVCVKGVLTVSVSPNGNSGDPFELLSKRVLAAFADVGAAERP